MLNDVVSQIQTHEMKPHSDKFRKQINEILERLEEEIRALSGEVVTETLTADNATVSQSLEARNISSEALLSDLITVKNAIIDELNAESAQFNSVESVNNKSVNIEANNITTQDITVTDAMHLNDLQATEIEASRSTIVNSTDTHHTSDHSVVNEDLTIANTTTIDSNGISTKAITSDAVVSDTIEATESISTVDLTSTDEATLNNAHITRAAITEEEVGDSIIHNLTNSSITGMAQLNVNPELATVYDWYAIDIPHSWHNYTLYLNGDYTNPNNQSLRHWSISILGTEQSAIIVFNQNAQEIIKDFSFDYITGRLRIRFMADDHINYWYSKLGDDDPLSIIYNAEAFAEIHAPHRNKGYVFQSYNDKTVEFYFGGEVFVNTLAAEFQEFEDQMTKRLYVERNIYLPSLVDEEEIVREWTEGHVGDYITNRENEFGHNRVKWESPVNNTDNTNPLYPELDGNKLITENTLANYNGTKSVTDEETELPKNEYPITELGDSSTVHGSIEVTHDLKVDRTAITPHIYDGQELSAADLADLADGTIYIDTTTNTAYRKSTVDNATRLDKIAVLKDSLNWTDGVAVEYDSATDTLRPTGSLKLTEADITGDLRVGGDAYITGTLHYTEEELIESTADFITLRANNSASLASGEYSGIAVNNYNGTDTLALATDADGTLKVGTGAGTSTTYTDLYYVPTTGKYYSDAELTTEVHPQGNLSSWSSIEKTDDYVHYEDAVFKTYSFSNMEAIATRDDEVNMSDKALTQWDATDTQLKTIPLPSHNEDVLTAVVTDATTTTVYTDGTVFYNADTTSTTEPSGTAGTSHSIGAFYVYLTHFYAQDSGLWYQYNDFSDLTDKTLVEDSATIDALNALTESVTISSVVYTTVAEVSGYTWKAKGAQSLIFDTVADYNTWLLTHEVPPDGSHIQIRNEENVIIANDYPIV